MPSFPDGFPFMSYFTVIFISLFNRTNISSSRTGLWSRFLIRPSSTTGYIFRTCSAQWFVIIFSSQKITLTSTLRVCRVQLLRIELRIIKFIFDRIILWSDQPLADAERLCFLDLFFHGRPHSYVIKEVIMVWSGMLPGSFVVVGELEYSTGNE